MTTLYRLYDADRQLLYVGIADRVAARLRQHEQEHDWWANVATITTEQFSDRESAESREKSAIRTEVPRHNRAHSTIYQRPAKLRLPGWTIEEFKAARAELGLTQTEMGKALGVPLNIVQKWESGDRPIRQVVAMAVTLLLERHRRKNAEAAAA